MLNLADCKTRSVLDVQFANIECFKAKRRELRGVARSRARRETGAGELLMLEDLELLFARDAG